MLSLLATLKAIAQNTDPDPFTDRCCHKLTCPIIVSHYRSP
ncbi:hypothetical protein QUB49_01480 [Microcoleus sp. AT9_B4]